jgi:hypothetical protein
LLLFLMLLVIPSILIILFSGSLLICSCSLAIKVDIKLIEPEVTYKAGVDIMMMRTPSYWSQLDSSKNRTAEQTEESKEVHVLCWCYLSDWAAIFYDWSNQLLYILSSFVLEMFAKPFIYLIIWMALCALVNNCPR